MTAAAEQSCAASVRLPQPPREDIIHVTHPPTQQCVDLALPLTVAGLTGTGQMAVWCSSLPHMLAFKHAAAERSVVAASAKRRVIVSDTNTHSQDESRVSRWWLWCQKSTRLCLHSASLWLQHSCVCLASQWLHSPEPSGSSERVFVSVTSTHECIYLMRLPLDPFKTCQTFPDNT